MKPSCENASSSDSCLLRQMTSGDGSEINDRCAHCHVGMQDLEAMAGFVQKQLCHAGDVQGALDHECQDAVDAVCQLIGVRGGLNAPYELAPAKDPTGFDGSSSGIQQETVSILQDNLADTADAGPVLEQTMDWEPTSANPAPTGSDLYSCEYSVECEIARGGMGSVLAATDRNTKRTVAMKEMLHANPRTRLRFVQEARIMGHLEHPNIVPMHQLGTNAKGEPFYTMKRIQGADLKTVLSCIRSGDAEVIAKYPLRSLLDVFLKVCDAIAFAHSQGVVHRDLKPHNIMLGEFGEVLVADWGLAKIMPGSPLSFLKQVEQDSPPRRGHLTPTATDTEHTVDGSVIGTPNYMSPEQAEGHVARIDERSDIFSLGGILYSILTLRPPVQGQTTREVLVKMRSADIIPPASYNSRQSDSFREPTALAAGVAQNDAPIPAASAVGSDAGAGERRSDGRQVHGQEPTLRHCPGDRIPEALSKVTMRSLQPQREERYQTVIELQNEIQAWQDGYATVAEEAGLIRQTRLFVSRNQVATFSAFSVLVLGSLLVSSAAIADRNAKAALVQMKLAAPLVEQNVEEMVNAGRIEEALQRVDSLLLLMNSNPDFHRQRGELLQSLARYDEAAVAFDQAIDLGGDSAVLRDSIAMSNELAAAAKVGIPDDLSERFLDYLNGQGRYPEENLYRGKWMEKGRERLIALDMKTAELLDEHDQILRSAVPSDQELDLPTPTSHWDFETNGRDRIGSMHFLLHDNARVEDGCLHLNGAKASVSTLLTVRPLQEYSMEIWAKVDFAAHDSATLFAIQKGGYRWGALQYNKLDSAGRWIFDRRARAPMEPPPAATHRLRGPQTNAQPDRWTQYVLTVSPEKVAIYCGGSQSMVADTSSEVKKSFRAYGDVSTRLELGRKTSIDESPTIKAVVAETTFFNRSLSAVEVDALRNANPLHYEEAELLDRLDDLDRRRLREVRTSLAELQPEYLAVNRVAGPERREELRRSYYEVMRKNGATKEAFTSLLWRIDGTLECNLGGRIPVQNSWVKGVPIVHLNLNGTSVTDLRACRGMPLQTLMIVGTDVRHLVHLQGMKLKKLDAIRTKINDLSPLQGMPLESFVLGRTDVSDLSPIAGAPLKKLEFNYTRVRSLEPLRDMSFEVLVGSDLEGLTDLSPIAGVPQGKVDLSRTGISDLSPLAGGTVAELWLSGCDRVRDVSPLMTCDLDRLLLPPKAENIEILRDHPSITHIGWATVNKEVPPKEKFWKAWDEGKRRP